MHLVDRPGKGVTKIFHSSFSTSPPSSSTSSIIIWTPCRRIGIEKWPGCGPPCGRGCRCGRCSCGLWSKDSTKRIVLVATIVSILGLWIHPNLTIFSNADFDIVKDATDKSSQWVVIVWLLIVVVLVVTEISQDSSQVEAD